MSGDKSIMELMGELKVAVAAFKRDFPALSPEPVKVPMPYAGECLIEELGATWLASFDFAASRLDDGWCLDEFQVDLVEKGQESSNTFTRIDYCELSVRSQERIRAEALASLEGAGNDEDDAYDRWKERDDG
jgi:hypothetical protein